MIIFSELPMHYNLAHAGDLLIAVTSALSFVIKNKNHAVYDTSIKFFVVCPTNESR